MHDYLYWRCHADRERRPVQRGGQLCRPDDQRPVRDRVLRTAIGIYIQRRYDSRYLHCQRRTELRFHGHGQCFEPTDNHKLCRQSNPIG